MLWRSIITQAGWMNAWVTLYLATVTASGQTNTVTLPSLATANGVIGMTVQNDDGKALGTVRSLVIEMSSARVHYVIVSSGGFLGIRSRVRAVPAEYLSAATAKRGIIGLDLTEARWRRAPGFAASDLAQLAQPARARELAAFYADSGHPRPGGSAENRGRKALEEPAMSATGRTKDTARSEQTKHEPKLMFAHDLIGRAVVNEEQEKIGEIQDLLFDFGTQAPALALISTGRFVKGHATYAVSLRVLISDPGKKVRWAVQPDTFLKAPPFDRKAWMQRRSEVYCYSSKH